MKQIPKASPERIRRILDYNRDTGILTWRTRTPDFFDHCKNPDSAWNRWNTAWAGKCAFTSDKTGYHIGRIDYGIFHAHTVIWCWMTGEWPTDPIIHLNGDNLDDRFNNLQLKHTPWRPICSAPKDGTTVDLFCGYREPNCYYDIKSGEWIMTHTDGYTEDVDDGTHWMPIPEGPEGE